MATQPIIRTFAVFPAFGLPFLLGYGVLPLPNFINELAALLGFGFLLILASQEPVPAALTPRRPFQALLVSLGVLGVLTVVQALRDDTPGAWELYTYTLCYLLLAALAFHLGWRGGQREDTADGGMCPIAIAIAIAAVLAAAAGLIQYFRLPQPVGLIPYIAEAGRAFGFIRQPNHQASFLVIGLQALIYLQVTGRLRAIVVWPLSLVMIAGVLATGSRTGLALLALALVWWLLSQGTRLLRYFIFILVCAAGLLGLFLWLHVHADVPFYFVAKINQSLGEGAGVRTGMWTETARMIARSPWLGGGLHRYGQEFLLSDAAINLKVVMSNAHNVWLQLAYDFGIPATLLVALALAACLWAARRGWQQPSRALALGLVGCIGVHSMLEFPLWYVHFLIMFMFMLGMAASAVVRPSEHPEEQVEAPVHGRMRLEQAMLASSGAALIVVGVWMNNDYYKVAPLFRRVAEVPVEQAIADAQGVTWFRRYVRYAELASRPVTAANAKAYWDGMENLSCLMLDPLYQTTLVAALGYQGRVEEAERLLYIYWRMGNKQVDNIKTYLDGHKGPAFDRLRDYLAHPTPVQVEPGRILHCLR